MSKGIVLDCMFYYKLFSGYTCIIQNESLITSIDDRVITGIRGEHLKGKSNDDVIDFCAEGKTIKFFPQNLTKYFKNIEKITIRNGKLQKITKEDLKEFGDKLERLNLKSNEIKVLKADLFEFNKNLEVISISDNKIKIIEPKTFDGLENLISLSLYNNPCTSENDYAHHNQQEVLELIKRVETSCIDSFIAEKLEEIFTFDAKTFEALNESNKKFESLKLENEKLEAKLSNEILLRNKENEEFKMESMRKILEKEKEILKLKEEVKKLKENEDLKAFMAEIIQGQEEKLKIFIEAQISSKLNLQATKISSLEEKMEKLKDSTSKSTNEIKNLIEGQISTLDAKIEMQAEKIIEDTKNAFNELKKDQKTFADAQERTSKLNLDKITNGQCEVKNLIQSQTNKVSSLDGKIEKEFIKLSRHSEKAFNEFKNHQENILKRINENLNDATLKSQNEVTNLITGQISTLDTKMNSLNDFVLKFNEKIEELQIKIAEDSKNVFNKLENGEKTLTDAQEKFHNKNVEKIDVDLKNYTEELQERFKEIKNLIESQNAANLSSQNENEEHQNETLNNAEKINQILSKILGDTSEVSEYSKKFRTINQEITNDVSALGHRVMTLTADLKGTVELYSSLLKTLQTLQNQNQEIANR